MKILILKDPYYWIIAVCWFVWFTSEMVNTWSSKQSQKEEKGKTKADNETSIGIYVSIAVLILMEAFSTFIPEYLTFKTAAFPLFIVGLICTVAGLSLRWTSIYIMGETFSRQIRTIEDQKIVKTGPFAYVRHPNYSAGFLMFFSFGLLFGSWISLVVGFLCGLIPYIIRIRVEEQFLLENLNGYARYCQEVRYHMIPFLY